MLDFNFSTHQEISLEIGHRIRVRRIALNLTQPDVAERAGVAKGTVSNIETKGQSSLESLIRVLQALNLVQELQPLFQSPVRSIEQLRKLEAPTRKRASKKRIS
ncbi:MAG: helix-turn-helix domain-containing protein [Pseudomonadota bacterium]